MPYKDPEQKKEWRRQAIKDGYGKRLYARRKLQRETMLLYREALYRVLSSAEIEDAHEVATEALEEGFRREEALQSWKRGVADAEGE